MKSKLNMENKKEIDLIALFARLLKFTKKYFVLVSVFFVIGISIGAADFYLGNNYYSTTFIASSPAINNQIVYELIEPVKYYIRNEMYDSISDKFDINEEVAKSVKSIDIDTSMIGAVKIELLISDKENVTELKEGLMTYFNSIPYVVSSIQSRRDELDDYLTSLNDEIEDLDNLQKSVLRNLEHNENARLISVGGLFNEMMDLKDKKLEILEEYNSLQYFSVISENMIFEVQKNLVKNLLVFSVIGFLIGLFLSVIIEINKLAKIAIKEE